MHRILHIVGVRWWSAIAAYAVDLLAAQHARGDTVRAAVLAGSPAERELTRRGFAPAICFGAGALDQLRLTGSIRRLAREEPLTILHVHTGLGHLAAERARRGIRPGPVLVRTRGDIRKPRRTPWSRRLHRTADAVVLSGRFLRPALEAIGVDGARLDVVTAGVDTERFAPEKLPERAQARRALGLPGDVFLAGIAARFSPVKGHQVALQAMRPLLSLDPPVHLVMAGEEAQLSGADLVAQARALGVADRVHVRPRVGDVREVLAALDAGLITSTGSEAICRICGEMMACEMPVIATSVSVLPDMIEDGCSGILVPAGAPDRLAEAMRRLHGDPGLRRSLGAGAREAAVTGFSLGQFAGRYAEIYDRAARARANR